MGLLVDYTTVSVIKLRRAWGESRRSSIGSMLSLEASRTPREMGSRQLDEGTGSSREGLDTDSGGGRRKKRAGCTSPRSRRHLMLHLMLEGPERRERRQSERGGTSQEGQGAGQEERIDSSRFNRGIIQDKG